ncbi:DsrE family protein [Marinicella sp. W31]|uniref:DsrE family protein n=1 Tax=Marinicella sp. W31 TaxID=3023713 RepID=UPI0037568FB3
MLRSIMCILIIFLSLIVTAEEEPPKEGFAVFHSGTLIPEYGKIATVAGMQKLPTDTYFKVSFDIAKPAKGGELNRALNSGARFLNMHVENGIKAEQIKLAFVIHGGAVHDMTVDTHYSDRNGQPNANAALIKALQAHSVEIFVCGQSAAYHGITKDLLLPGVKLSLSAMTAHALLQQQGYTLNPF